MRVLYDPTFSERGVLMCAGRKLRAKDPFDFQVRPCRLRCRPLINWGCTRHNLSNQAGAPRVYYICQDVAKGCSDRCHSLHGHPPHVGRLRH